jgi:hypothetical protein
MVFPKKVHVKATLNFRLQKNAQAVIKLMSQKWYIGVKTEWYPFVKFLAKSWYLFLRLVKICFKKSFLFGTKFSSFAEGVVVSV